MNRYEEGKLNGPYYCDKARPGGRRRLGSTGGRAAGGRGSASLACQLAIGSGYADHMILATRPRVLMARAR